MKDPAFLFYPGDWLGGTMLLTRHQKGCYMDLLMAQFNSGHLSLDQIKHLLGPDANIWPLLSSKFKTDPNGLWFNEKLETEILKRKSYSESRRKNREKKEEITHDNTYDQSYDLHMENENENRNEFEKRKGVQGENKGADPSHFFSPSTDQSRFDILFKNAGIADGANPERQQFIFDQFCRSIRAKEEPMTKKAHWELFSKWVNTWAQNERKDQKSKPVSGRDKLKQMMGAN